MAEEKTIKETKDPNIFKTTLTESGINVVLDKSKCNGHALMRARMAGQGGEKTTFYLIAECCTFDGKKMIAEDLFDLSAFDLSDLEEFFAKSSKKYQALATSLFSPTKQGTQEQQ